MKKDWFGIAYTTLFFISIAALAVKVYTNTYSTDDLIYVMVTMIIMDDHESKMKLKQIEDKMDLYNKNRMMDTELLRLYLQNRFTDMKNLIKK